MLRMTFAIAAFSLSLACPTVKADQQNVHWQDVSGTAIHYFSTAITHPNTQEANPTGFSIMTTDTIDLFGDIEGRVLYQPYTVVNTEENTLVNTGHQVFSGTVLDSDPVMLYDNSFRFDVDLNTGATEGEIFLVKQIAGPKVRCVLTVVGTGMTPEGDGLAEYSGQCRIW